MVQGTFSEAVGTTQIWLSVKQSIKDFRGSVMRRIGSTRIEPGGQCKGVPPSHTMHLCVHRKRARNWNGTMQAATTKNCIPVSKWIGAGRQAETVPKVDLAPLCGGSDGMEDF